jgi:hypothetical protein
VSSDERVTDVTALRPGLGSGFLTFTQSYHPSWQVTTSDGGVDPVVALGFANGYRLPEGSDPTAITMGLARLGRIGTTISGTAWCAALIAVAFGRRRRRRAATVPDG